MIDVHTHILPGVDDGSQDIENSIAMLKLAEKAGFHAIILTPHYMSYTKYISSLSKNKKIMRKLNRRVKDEHLRLKLYLGNEVFFDPDILSMFDTGRFISLNKKNYYLVETVRHDANVEHFEEFLYRLQLRGYIPIIAHPERYDFVQNDPNLLLDFINKGSLVQMNMLSLVGSYGHKAKDTAELLLEGNMVQFMASDAHQCSAYERIEEAMDKAWELIGDNKFDVIMKQNPRIILSGQGTVSVNAHEVEKKSKGFFFGKK